MSQGEEQVTHCGAQLTPPPQPRQGGSSTLSPLASERRDFHPFLPQISSSPFIKGDGILKKHLGRSQHKDTGRDWFPRFETIASPTLQEYNQGQQFSGKRSTGIPKQRIEAWEVLRNWRLVYRDTLKIKHSSTHRETNKSNLPPRTYWLGLPLANKINLAICFKKKSKFILKGNKTSCLDRQRKPERALEPHSNTTQMLNYQTETWK